MTKSNRHLKIPCLVFLHRSRGFIAKMAYEIFDPINFSISFVMRILGLVAVDLQKADVSRILTICKGKTCSKPRKRSAGNCLLFAAYGKHDQPVPSNPLSL